MAGTPSAPSTTIGPSPLTAACTSVGGARLRTSAFSPYFLNKPRSWAIHAGEKAEEGCENGISSVPLGTGFGAALAPSGLPSVLAAAGSAGLTAAEVAGFAGTPALAGGGLLAGAVVWPQALSSRKQAMSGRSRFIVRHCISERRL